MVQINYIDLPSLFLAAQTARQRNQQMRMAEVQMAEEARLRPMREQQALQQSQLNEEMIRSQIEQRQQAMTAKETVLRNQRLVGTYNAGLAGIKAIRQNPQVADTVIGALRAGVENGALDKEALGLPEFFDQAATAPGGAPAPLNIGPQELDQLEQYYRTNMEALGGGVAESDPKIGGAVAQDLLNRGFKPRTPEWDTEYEREKNRQEQAKLRRAEVMGGYQEARTEQLRRQMSKEEAETESALTTGIYTVEDSISTIDDLEKHPSLNYLLGSVEGLTPVVRQGSVDAKALVDQIKSENFLQAIQKMRGTGPISDREGAAATAAIGNLDLRQSPEQFRRTLARIKRSLARMGDELKKKRARLEQPQQKAQQGQRQAIPEITDEELDEFAPAGG